MELLYESCSEEPPGGQGRIQGPGVLWGPRKSQQGRVTGSSPEHKNAARVHAAGLGGESASCNWTDRMETSWENIMATYEPEKLLCEGPGL